MITLKYKLNFKNRQLGYRLIPILQLVMADFVIGIDMRQTEHTLILKGNRDVQSVVHRTLCDLDIPYRILKRENELQNQRDDL